MKEPENNYPEVQFESRFISVGGAKIHYIESGTHDPPILLLHGIPTHSYIWRKVIPHLSPHARTIAVDLIGFGRSDKPLDINYDLPTYTRFLEEFITALELDNITIVGMDLGLIVGLNYAMNHEERIRSLVIFEGFFEPMNIAYKNLPLFNRFSLWLMKNKRISRHMILDDGIHMVEQMMNTATLRKLSKEEISIYQEPFKDVEVRRKVWLEGVGPRAIKRNSDHPGDLVDLINRYSEKLSKSKVPKLLIYGEPGMVVSERTAESARKSIPNLMTRFIGKGKHFLPEDEPDALGETIAEFYLGIPET
jgi:haloalkane dehalogenase